VSAPEPSTPGRVLARFPHPEPPRGRRARILPLFLPFAGCPQRCLFCNQPAQTGAAPQPLEATHARLAALLEALPVPRTEAVRVVAKGNARPGGKAGAAFPAPLPPNPAPTLDPAAQEPASPDPLLQSPRAPELAFYGGTFTALPAPWPQRFLELAQPYLLAGRLARVRCSTRPDAVSAPLLAELKGLGLSLVELGVQSFDASALAASRRGYDGATALRGCAAVRAAGLSLGVQLMPGLPGQSAEAFDADVAQTAELAPELARLYPCLVLAGTELADRWRAGAYAPWTLDAAVDALARALLRLWDAGVPAARLGLAEQEGLSVLAGPRHPALGQLARSRALLLYVGRQVEALRERGGPPPAVLLLPRRLQGEALGQRNALARDYAALGLGVRLWDEADLALCTA
jgi:histone acetyltransferase (RNA polymerase elongator complex component)